MRLLGRMLVILFAALIASFAGGLTVALAVLLPELTDFRLGPFEHGALGVLMAFGIVFVSATAIVPALLVIGAAESFAIRSALFYAAAGALLGAVLFFNFGGWAPSAVLIHGFARRELEVMIGAGIVAGVAYWLVAGRNAGKWREPRREPGERVGR